MSGGHEGRRAIVGFLGKTGTGKTTELRKYSGRARRLLVADIERKWVLQPGDELVVGYRALLDRLDALKAWGSRVPFRLVYQEPVDPRPRMREIPFKVALQLGRLSLVLDEASYFCEASYLPPAFDELVLTGRHESVNLLFTTQRPQRIHNSLFDMADLICFFRTEPGLALARIRELWGRELADGLPALSSPADCNKKGGGVTLDFRTYGNLEALKLFGREGSG